MQDELRGEIQNEMPRDLREIIRELMVLDGVVAANPDDFVERVFDLVMTQATDSQYRLQMKKLRVLVEQSIQELSR